MKRLEDEDGNDVFNVMGLVVSRTLFSVWAQADVTGALNWLAGNTGGIEKTDTLFAAYTTLMAEWMEASPVEAADFAVRLPKGGVKSAILKQIVYQWAEIDLKGVISWMKIQSLDEDYDLAIIELLGIVEDKDANQITFWFDRLSSPEAINHAVYWLYQRYGYSDPAEAVYLLSAYTPGTDYDQSNGYFTFPSEYHWQYELAERLVRWAAVDESGAIEYLNSIDFLDESGLKKVNELFHQFLKPQRLWELLSLIERRYHSEINKNGLNGGAALAHFAELMKTDSSGDDMEKLKKYTQYYKRINPRAIRYYLETQEVVGGEELAELMAILEQD